VNEMKTPMKKSTKYMLIGLFEIILLIVAIGAFYLITKNNQSQDSEKAETVVRKPSQKDESKPKTYTSKYEMLSFKYDPKRVTLKDEYGPGLEEGLNSERLTATSGNYVLELQNGMNGLGGFDPCSGDEATCEVVETFPLTLFNKPKTLDLRKETKVGDCLSEEECKTSKTTSYNFVIGSDRSIATYFYNSKNIISTDMNTRYINLITLYFKEGVDINPATVKDDPNFQALLEVISSLHY
jgi:hypothetical protein